MVTSAEAVVSMKYSKHKISRARQWRTCQTSNQTRCLTNLGVSLLMEPSIHLVKLNAVYYNREGGWLLF